MKTTEIPLFLSDETKRNFLWASGDRRTVGELTLEKDTKDCLIRVKIERIRAVDDNVFYFNQRLNMIDTMPQSHADVLLLSYETTYFQLSEFFVTKKDMNNARELFGFNSGKTLDVPLRNIDFALRLLVERGFKLAKQ